MIHPTKNHRLIPFIAVFVALVLLTGTVHAASVVLGYGGTTSTNGAGVYPVQATGNSERYFRCILSIANTEVLTNLTITGVNGTTQLYPKPNGNWNDASDGVTRYLISGGTTAVWAYTIGPYVGRDIYGNQHCPTQSIGTVSGQVGEADWPFTFYATTVPTGGGTPSTVNSGTGTYRTQSTNRHSGRNRLLNL